VKEKVILNLNLGTAFVGQLDQLFPLISSKSQFIGQKKMTTVSDCKRQVIKCAKKWINYDQKITNQRDDFG